MKKTFAQSLVIFWSALLLGVPAQANDQNPHADGCAYSDWLSDEFRISYGRWLYDWNWNETKPFSPKLLSQNLKTLDAGLKACSLPAGKNIPDPDPYANIWLDMHRGSFVSPPYSADKYDAHFNQADALVLAGPSVKDGVTRYWQRNGKTHIRFALNNATRILRSWAKRRGIALQLTRQQSDGPIKGSDPIILRGKTAIPVFVVSPEGLTPARIVAFAVGGDSCTGGDWLEMELTNDTTPPVWAIIALRDPKLARKAKVTRQRQLETRKDKSHDLEIKRGVLRLEFENDALPPLILVARQLGFVEHRYEMGETENDWIKTGEKTLLGSAWGTEVFLFDPAMEAPPKTEDAYGNPAFGPLLGFLGSPACPPPEPE